jgi:aspartate/methionine/tyrosine aminotransferase
VDADSVLLTASTSEAYAFLFKLLCDPGETVLVPAPSYPLFEYIAGLESVRTITYPLRYADEWRLDVAAVAEGIGPGTRAVVVVSPNNPTGSFLKRTEARALLSLAAERGLALISDEVFADYAWEPDARRAPSLAGDGPALAFTLGGLSKSCGLPQLKLGWIVLSGPETLRTEALERLEIVADTYLSVSTPIQRAASAVLVRGAELQALIAARVAHNHRVLRERLDSASPVSLLHSEGGWTAVLRVPATVPEEDRVLRLLDEDDVLVHPGYFFDFPAEAFLVLSLLPEPQVFAEGLARLLRSFERD